MAKLVEVEYKGEEYEDGRFIAPELELEDGHHAYAIWGVPPAAPEVAVFACGTKAEAIFPIYHTLTDERAESLVTYEEYKLLLEAIDKVLL